MLCKKPFNKDGRTFGCGQCMPCRINHRRMWASRIILESRMHAENSFVTLTYDDDHLPKGNTLDPSDPQKWLKRLRHQSPGLRYYLVGEYGEQSLRPHYHAALFGFPSCANHLQSAYERSRCVCAPCRTIRDSWQNGKTDVGTLTPESAQYLAGYITKKLTNKDDPTLNGRAPEFARMSRCPGIGATALAPICEGLSTSAGAALIASSGDVPLALKQGGKSLPLGRYLRRKLREEIGFDEIGEQSSAPARQHKEVLAMLETAGSVSQYLKEKQTTTTVKIRQLETRSKIWSKKGSI